MSLGGVVERLAYKADHVCSARQTGAVDTDRLHLAGWYVSLKQRGDYAAQHINQVGANFLLRVHGETKCGLWVERVQVEGLEQMCAPDIHGRGCIGADINLRQYLDVRAPGSYHFRRMERGRLDPVEAVAVVNGGRGEVAHIASVRLGTCLGTAWDGLVQRV